MTDPRQPLPTSAPRPAGIPAHPPTHNPTGHVQGQTPAPPLRAPVGSAVAAPQPARVVPPSHGHNSIELIADGEDAEVLHKKIKAFGNENTSARTKNWMRQPAATGNGAVRVRTFHAKLSDQGMEFLDDSINHFIDEHPEVHVKFVTTSIGMFDGKFKDMALIVNVWY
jgi:hypothetical protein